MKAKLFLTVIFVLLTTGCNIPETEVVKPKMRLEEIAPLSEEDIDEDISYEIEESASSKIDADEEITFKVNIPKAEPKPVVTVPPKDNIPLPEPEKEKKTQELKPEVTAESKQETQNNPETTESEIEPLPPTATESTEKVSGKEVLPPEQAQYNFIDPKVDFWGHMEADVIPWIEWGSSAKDTSTKEERIEYISQTEWGRKGLDRYGY